MEQIDESFDDGDGSNNETYIILICCETVLFNSFFSYLKLQ